MNYSSTRTIDSKSCEGVRFTIKRMTVWRRDELHELQRPITERMQSMREELDGLTEEYQAAFEAAQARVKPERDCLIASGATKEEAEKQVPLGKLDLAPEKFRRWAELKDQLGRTIRRELTPNAVRYALVSIDGLVIDREPARIDELLKSGPDELYAEIAQEVGRELGISEEERENLSSPSTSAAVVDGSKKDGSAAIAGMPDTITSGVAPSSTDRESANVLTMA